VELRTLVVATFLICAVQIEPAFSLETSKSTERPAQLASVSEPNGATNRKRLDKLRMANFAKYQVRLLMPVQFQKKDDFNQLTAIGADIPHGMLMFTSMMAPANVRLDAAAIRPILSGILEAMKAECDRETSLKIQDGEGLEYRGKVKVTADVEAVVRGYVSGRRMHFVSAMGTGPWVRSSDVTRYLNSLEIMP
jgi:hypothetical protein